MSDSAAGSEASTVVTRAPSRVERQREVTSVPSRFIAMPRGSGPTAIRSRSRPSRSTLTTKPTRSATKKPPPRGSARTDQGSLPASKSSTRRASPSRLSRCRVASPWQATASTSPLTASARGRSPTSTSRSSAGGSTLNTATRSASGLTTQPRSPSTWIGLERVGRGSEGRKTTVTACVASARAAPRVTVTPITRAPTWSQAWHASSPSAVTPSPSVQRASPSPAYRARKHARSRAKGWVGPSMTTRSGGAASGVAGPGAGSHAAIITAALTMRTRRTRLTPRRRRW